MTAILRASLLVLGAAAAAIGASIFLFGASATAGAFAAVLRLLVPETGPVTGLAGPDADNELRFYAVFWAAYGVFIAPPPLLALWYALRRKG